MNENTFNLDIDNIEIQEILEELDELELQLINSENLEKDYGFVFAKGGGSRPRVSMDY
ncbi:MULTISPECIES: hypothetical protein [unclassified Gemella]|uniref:hypothetical protein n=1 Tax=unclassified Gemella TaxID=2624949 RepID=UPI001C042F69|nr:MULTISPECIES: hypothetical protein [unclassified Gemella]MBU0279069.1 hypothetical protein [Gemella sp. zg-1178]QWQ39125.1 hypothetical protein KMP11_01975 [Gemella sp. zg-570]